VQLIPDHAGIVVEDFAGAVAGLSVLFGEPSGRMHIPEVGLRSATFERAGLPVEVLCFESGAVGEAAGELDPRVFEAVEGIQHLAYRVGDLGEAMGQLQACGLPVLQGFPRRGVHGEILFFTVPGTPVLWELVERGPGPAGR
jgi:catechol 2,3-dioxygenase-like lactoylglutathione lyase family enzyme